MDPSRHDSSRSLERVYREYLTYVWRTLRALGVVPSAIDDAAQDVFIVVHRRLHEFEGRASMKTWLYEITRRVALRYRSRAATDAARTFELPQLRAVDDLDAAVDRAMAAEVLRSFIATLDEDRRRAFVLAELWEMRGREIAEALDVNMNTVYARLRSARTDLDRMARRLRARNAPALTRMVRQTRPAERTKARTWGLLVAKLSTGSVSVATATGAVGAGVLKWAAMGGLTSALLLASVAAVKGPEAESPAPTQRVAATQPDPIVAPPSAAPRPQRPTVAKPTDATSPATADRVVDEEQSARATRPRPSAKPSLTDEVARVKKIRRAVARADRAPAQAAIDAYRREFGEGALRLEVDALSVELACRISADDARRRLRDFKRRRPDAHLVHRVEKTCAGQIGPQKPGDARTPSR